MFDKLKEVIFVFNHLYKFLLVFAYFILLFQVEFPRITLLILFIINFVNHGKCTFTQHIQANILIVKIINGQFSSQNLVPKMNVLIFYGNQCINNSISSLNLYAVRQLFSFTVFLLKFLNKNII